MYMHVCMSVEFCGGEMGGIRAGEIGRIEFMKYIFFIFLYFYTCVNTQRFIVRMPVLTHMHTFAYKDEYVYVLVYAHVHTRDFDQGFLE